MTTQKMHSNCIKKIGITAFVFILTMASLIFSIPASFADATNIQTSAYISVSPNPIGVNQPVMVYVWITPVLATNSTFNSFSVKFTKPDGSVVTKGPFSSQSNGFGTFTFVPDQNGTWYYQFSYGGGDTINGYPYQASNSPVSNLTVQSTPLPGFQPAYLPTSGEFSFWGRPIYAWNIDWATATGDWQQIGYNASNTYFNPYSTMPTSGHILWTKQTGVGGLVGGAYGNASYSDGSNILMVVGGLAYYQASDGMHCVDVHTGKELWVKPGINPTVGVPVPQYQINGGVTLQSELLQTGNNYVTYDPFTGVVTSNVTGALSGIYSAPYFYSYSNGRLITWQPSTNASTSSVTNFEKFVVSNVSCSFGFNHIWNGIGVAINPWPQQSSAVDLTTGNTLWNMTIPLNESPMGAVSIADGKIYVGGQGMVFRAYDIHSGNKLWTSQPAQYPWGAFWSNYSACAYGNLYGLSYDGHIYCFDASNGQIKWAFYSGNSSGLTNSNTWAFSANPVIADGKIYASTGDYSTSSQTVSLGNMLYCINATSGTSIWQIYFAGGSKVVADSELLATNEYDGKLYCFGQGPTSVQVTASPTTEPNGTSILIQGYVLDQSPGQPGTPCISDQDMAAYMQFLHMEQPCPSTIIGVPVELRAITSTGSIIEIINASSPTNLYGHFSYVWTPNATGQYTILARYHGDDSYLPSWTSAGISVTATSPTPIPTPTATPIVIPDYTTLFVVIIAAVIISIAIGLYSIYDHSKLRKQ
jgi:hypothetical protein